MQDQTGARPGAGFWLVSALSLLWNGFGATDYTMTKLHNAAWFSAMKVDPALVAKVDAAPVWATAGWAVGVWAALVGSVLLVLRKRAAGTWFLASIVGAVIGFGWQISVGLNSLALAGFIVGLEVFFLWFARRAEGQGLLS